MKKIILVLLVSILCFTGCSKNNKSEEIKEEGQSSINKIINTFTDASIDNDGNIVIDTSNITDVATLVNYKVDDVVIQFIVVRRSDGTVGLAFNTCQACNPSPNAYFIQKGKYFECQNCGNRFYIDDIGREAGGCNPAPVLKYTEEENIITIDKEYADSYKEKFANWNGVLSSN